MSLYLASVQSGGAELENQSGSRALMRRRRQAKLLFVCYMHSLREAADCVLSEQLAPMAEKREEDEMLACRDAKEQLLVETLESSVRSPCSSEA